MKKSRKQISERIQVDTKIEVLEKKYGIDFGVRSDMKISTFLKGKGYKSLVDMLKA